MYLWKDDKSLDQNSLNSANKQVISKVISVCSKKDLVVWAVASQFILKHIKSISYEVIVPDQEVEIFKSVTPQSFTVKRESYYLKEKGLKWLEKFFPENNKNRAGWYLQQIIKIEACRSNNQDKVVLIWDADTVPIKPIKFFDQNGKLNYYVGTENHSPYFQAIERLIGLNKIVEFSFISQSFPVNAKWVQEFCDRIENKFNMNWISALVEHLDTSTFSGFSEYESIGTYISHFHRNEITFAQGNWYRYGNSLIGGVQNLTAERIKELAKQYDYLSFELWD